MNDDATQRQFLRHCVATLAYRGGKAIRDAPPGFAKFRAAPESRSASEILAHVGDLFDWACALVEGRSLWSDSAARTWPAECERFFATLAHFDSVVAGDAELAASAERLFQGPIADALTHVGQLAMLRRLAGSPVRGENYFKGRDRRRAGGSAAGGAGQRVRLGGRAGAPTIGVCEVWAPRRDNAIVA